MCTVSMVITDQTRRWDEYQPQIYPSVTDPYQKLPVDPVISEGERKKLKEEIAEFRELLERARKWDAEHGEPDCESDDKIEALRKVAEALGIADEVDIVLKEVDITPKQTTITYARDGIVQSSAFTNAVPLRQDGTDGSWAGD